MAEKHFGIYSRFTIGVVVALCLAVATPIVVNRLFRLQRTWFLSTGHKLTVSQGRGLNGSNAAKLIGKQQSVDIPGIKSPIGEHVALDNIDAVEVDHLVGILLRPKVLYIGKNNSKLALESWTRLVLLQTLGCVIDLRTGRVWNHASDASADNQTTLRDQFIADMQSDETKRSGLFRGIEFIDVNGNYVTAELVSRLNQFPDLRSLSIEEGRLSADIISAIRSISHLRELWFRYIQFDASTLKSLEQLDNLDRMTFSSCNMNTIPNAEEIVDRIRKASPNTLIRVLTDAD